MSQNIYTQLKNIVLPNLKNFKDDLIVTDKAMLKNYTGAFLYAYRENGTNIFLLDVNDFDYSKTVKQIELRLSNILVYLKGNNKAFLHFDTEYLKVISFDQFSIEFSNFSTRVLRRKKLIDALNIESIAFELLSLMSNTRNWKSYILETSNPSLRRLRNYFDYTKIKSTNDLSKLKLDLYEKLS